MNRVDDIPVDLHEELRRLLEGRTLQTLILQGLRTFGTTDPEEVLPLIEEDLTQDEHWAATAFLVFLTDKGKSVGIGNWTERVGEMIHALRVREAQSMDGATLLSVLNVVRESGYKHSEIMSRPTHDLFG